MPNAILIPNSGTTISVLGDVVDGWPEVTHKLETNIGGEPLEDGREVTDHAVARQSKLILTGWVSDFNGGNRQREAWDKIREVHKAVEPIQVITEWGIYDEMLIDRAEAPHTNRGMMFTIEFREVTRVGITDLSLPAGQLSGGAAEGRSSGASRGRVRLGSAQSLEAFQ